MTWQAANILQRYYVVCGYLIAKQAVSQSMAEVLGHDGDCEPLETRLFRLVLTKKRPEK